MGIRDMYIEWNKILKVLAKLNEGIYLLIIIFINKVYVSLIKYN